MHWGRRFGHGAGAGGAGAEDADGDGVSAAAELVPGAGETAMVEVRVERTVERVEVVITVGVPLEGVWVRVTGQMVVVWKMISVV